MTSLYLALILMSFFLLIAIKVFFIFLNKRALLSSRDNKIKRDGDGPFCHYHQAEKAVGVCEICALILCQSCLEEAGELNFCTEHLEQYLEGEWSLLTTLIATAENPEVAMPLYHFKDQLWLEKVPCIIKTQYEINTAHDYIESHISLMVRQSDHTEVNIKWNLKTQTG